MTLYLMEVVGDKERTLITDQVLGDEDLAGFSEAAEPGKTCNPLPIVSLTIDVGGGQLRTIDFK
ncbi:MAG: hypothetical protein K8T91_25795 [Planctomycetes bacterium]|nr:hypothetical protein [Planctomycetota bacterium]